MVNIWSYDMLNSIKYANSMYHLYLIFTSFDEVFIGMIVVILRNVFSCLES